MRKTGQTVLLKGNFIIGMEQTDSITEHSGIKRYRSVAAVCAIYPDAQTHLYLKLTSFCVNILIVLFRVLILVK